MAYSDKVIDHHNHPRNVGSIPKDDPNVATDLLGAPECGDVMKLQMKINSETQAEWVKGGTSRKRWPSRTRISSASSAFPRATLPEAIRYARIAGRLHLVGSPIF